MENTKYYKRALNIINDFQKSEMEFETFIEKPTFSKLGLISAYSISQIDNLEKEKAQKILDKKLLELHEAWKGYFTDLGRGYVEIRFRHN